MLRAPDTHIVTVKSDLIAKMLSTHRQRAFGATREQRAALPTLGSSVCGTRRPHVVNKSQRASGAQRSRCAA
jgi:hypothetical protein